MSFSPTPQPLEDSMTGVLTDEKLERVFREIEEASERRALEEEEAASHPGPLDPFVSALTNAELMLAKKRRRQSISVSRVGSYADVPAEVGSGPGSPVPWAAPPPLYRANTYTSTTSSISTTTSSLASSHARLHEEENHTTQKETIAGRRNTLTKAMSSAFSRTLTRMRSRGAINEVLPGAEALVIGVAVHEATTEERTTIDLSGDGAIPPKDVDRQGGPGAGTLEGVEQARVESRVEAGAGEASAAAEAGPSRRMSITVSTAVSAVNPKQQEATRSRSGSINKLRGKLPLRNPTHTASSSTDMKQAATNAADDSGVGSGAEEGSEKEGGKGPSAKSSRRISYFAKALAQRLRRRRSGEENEREKEKDGGSSEKEKDRKKVKEKNGGDQSPASGSGSGSQRSDKSSKSEKTGKRLSFVPPAPIRTEPSVAVSAADAAARLDQPIIKSPLLAAPSLSEPSISSSSGSGTETGATTGLSVNEGSMVVGALPPSPRRLPSASEIPLPPSPAGSPRSPSASSVKGVIVQKQLDVALKERKDLDTEPALIPLPPTPITSTFSRSVSPERRSDATSSSAPIPITNPESRRRRLPPSALPDSDFGPMGESTPAPTPTPSPTESAMTVPVLVSAPSRDASRSASRRESAIVMKDEDKDGAEIVAVDIGRSGGGGNKKDVPGREQTSELRDEEEEKKEDEFGVEVKVVPPLESEKVDTTSEKTIEL